jgi:hypothetical protein
MSERIEARELIPQPLKAEFVVEVKLPDEVTALVRDLHNDRQHIGLGLAVVVVAIVAVAVTYLFRREG